MEKMQMRNGDEKREHIKQAFYLYWLEQKERKNDLT
jgi:hypothetical protein